MSRFFIPEQKGQKTAQKAEREIVFRTAVKILVDDESQCHELPLYPSCFPLHPLSKHLFATIPPSVCGSAECVGITADRYIPCFLLISYIFYQNLYLQLSPVGGGSAECVGITADHRIGQCCGRMLVFESAIALDELDRK